MHLQENGINISVINGTARAKVFFEYAEGNFNTPLDDLFEDVVGTQTGRTGAMRFYNVATRVYRNGESRQDYSHPSTRRNTNR